MLGFFVCLFICLFFLFFVARVCRAARLCSHLRTGGWVYWKSFHPRDLMWHWGHNPHTWVGLNTSLRHRNTKHYLDLWRKCSFLIFYRRSILPRKHPFHLYQEVENSLLNLSMLGIKSSVNFTPLIFFFFLFMAAPAADGSSWASGKTRAATASLHHSHSNAGVKLHLQPRATPDP